MTVFSRNVAFYRTAVEELNAWLKDFPDTPTTKIIQSHVIPASTLPMPATWTGVDPLEPVPYTRLTWQELCQLREPERDWQCIKKVLASARDATQSAQGYCFYARAMWAERDYGAASRELNCALAVDPRNAFAMQLLGETKYFQKDYYGAVNWLTNSIASSPRCGRAYMGRALAFEQIADSLAIDLRGIYYKQALRDYSSAYLLLPTKQLVIGPAITRAQRLVEEFSV